MWDIKNVIKCDYQQIWVNLITTEACSPEAWNHGFILGKSSPTGLTIQVSGLLFIIVMYPDLSTKVTVDSRYDLPQIQHRPFSCSIVELCFTNLAMGHHLRSKGGGWNGSFRVRKLNCLVAWNMFYLYIYWERHHPNIGKSYKYIGNHTGWWLGT